MESRASIADGPVHRFIGSWQGEVTVEGAGVPAEHYVQHNTFAWTLDGRFLEERGSGSNGSSFLGMWYPDPQGSLYRAHYFIAPSGDVVVLTQEWNEAARTFNGSAELGGGVRMLTTDHFLDGNNYEWSITIQDATGGLISRMYAREHRIVR